MHLYTKLLKKKKKDNVVILHSINLKTHNNFLNILYFSAFHMTWDFFLHLFENIGAMDWIVTLDLDLYEVSGAHYCDIVQLSRRKCQLG